MVVAMLLTLLQQDLDSCVVIVSATNRAVDLLYNEVKPLVLRMEEEGIEHIVLRVASVKGNDIFAEELAQRAERRLEPYFVCHMK